MPSIRRRLLLGLLLAGTSVLAVAAVAAAAEIRSGDRADVPADEVVQDDLYITGGTVVVAGTVQGDLIAAGGSVTVSGTVEDNLVVAGGAVTVSGIVHGDVFAAGGTVTISGTVNGDIRVAGGSITLSGVAREDVVAAGGAIEAERGSTIGGDVLLSGGLGTLAGTVAGNVRASADQFRLFGKVDGNVEAKSDRVSIGPQGEIGGSLTYTSRGEAAVASGGVVRGAVTREVPRRRVLFYEGPDSLLLAALARVVGQLRWFAATALVGLALLWLLPAFTMSAHDALRGSPWRSLGLGLGLLVLYPLAAIIIGVLALLVTGSAGLPVLLLPLLPLIAAFFLAAIVAGLVVGIAALQLRPPAAGTGGRASPRPGYALLAGLALLAVIDLVPIVGAVARLVVIVLGIGALGLALSRAYSRARAAGTA